LASATAGRTDTSINDGFYNVAPLALDPTLASAPQDLLIAKPDTSDYYHLSYRTPIGFDTQIDLSAFSSSALDRDRLIAKRGRTALKRSSIP